MDGTILDAALSQGIWAVLAVFHFTLRGERK